VNPVVLAAAAVFLTICIGMFWWGTRDGAAGQRHTIFVFAWLCAALTAALVVFSLFPTSQADGTVLGVTLGGAGAFVMLVWAAALRAADEARRDDKLEGELHRRDAEIARLKKALEGAEARRQPQARHSTGTYLYEMVEKSPKHWIGIIAGDIRRVRCVDVWVNSENTDMAMSRIYEYSVSGIIRYEGARHDNAGRVMDDSVADELTRTVADRRPVAAGTAVFTGSGELARRNDVRYVIHVASVQGEPGAGFRQVREVGRCVYSALAEAEQLGGDERPVESILFPLLGTGTAGADLTTTVDSMINATVDYLATTRSTRIKTVYFLAYTDVELATCRAALDSCSRMRPADQTAPRTSRWLHTTGSSAY
jgi:O-acetyl-ADP-ribose deacetylase (regulator of RNase III)